MISFLTFQGRTDHFSVTDGKQNDIYIRETWQFLYTLWLLHIPLFSPVIVGWQTRGECDL